VLHQELFLLVQPVQLVLDLGQIQVAVVMLVHN
jgi:hypothetical protein